MFHIGTVVEMLHIVKRQPYEAHFVLASFARQASKYMKHRLTAV